MSCYCWLASLCLMKRHFKVTMGLIMIRRRCHVLFPSLFFYLLHFHLRMHANGQLSIAIRVEQCACVKLSLTFANKPCNVFLGVFSFVRYICSNYLMIFSSKEMKNRWYKILMILLITRKIMDAFSNYAAQKWGYVSDNLKINTLTDKTYFYWYIHDIAFKILSL